MKLILHHATRSDHSCRQRHAAAPWSGMAIRRLAAEPLVRRIVKGCAAFTVLLLGGTVGYMLIEGWSALDALFMTAITLSTVGYGEVEPLSAAAGGVAGFP